MRVRPEVQRFAELMEWKLRGKDNLADMTEWELWVAVMARLHRSCDLDEALEESLVVAALAAYAYSKVAQRVHAQDPGGEL